VLGRYYHTLADALAVHEEVMHRTGTSPAPLRDEGALASALNRPLTAAHYEDASLATQAVLLMTGVALNHPFVDGNKRTAFALADTFIDENGFAFVGDYQELAERLVALVAEADHRAREQAVADLIAWLDPQLVPTSTLPSTRSLRDR
jgi:death-on-curing protein